MNSVLKGLILFIPISVLITFFLFSPLKWRHRCVGPTTQSQLGRLSGSSKDGFISIILLIGKIIFSFFFFFSNIFGFFLVLFCFGFFKPSNCFGDPQRAAATWPVVSWRGQQVSHLGVLQSFHPLDVQGSEQRTAGGAEGRNGRPGAARQQQHTQTCRGQHGQTTHHG